MCAACLEGICAILPNYKSEKRVVPISQMAPVAARKCSKGGAVLDFWCEECEKAICENCKMFGDHSTGQAFEDHHVVDIRVKHENLRQELTRHKQKHFKAAKYTLTRNVEAIEKRLSKVGDNVETLLKVVREE